MTRTLVTTVVGVITLLATRAAAQEPRDPSDGPATTRQAPHDESPGGYAATGGAHHESGPVPPETKVLWPGVVLIVVAAMFVLAAVIGPLARMHAPPAEMPPTHSHDEPPGASHHHGASGTTNPEPDHGHH